MDITFVQEFSADVLSGSAFKKDIVRDNDCCAAVLFEQGFYMLDKIELLV